MGFDPYPEIQVPGAGAGRSRFSLAGNPYSRAVMDAGRNLDADPLPAWNLPGSAARPAGRPDPAVAAALGTDLGERNGAVSDVQPP